MKQRTKPSKTQALDAQLRIKLEAEKLRESLSERSRAFVSDIPNTYLLKLCKELKQLKEKIIDRKDLS